MTARPGSAASQARFLGSRREHRAGRARRPSQRGARPPRGVTGRRGPVAALGAVCRRPPVGDRPRGLLGRRRRLGLLPVRARSPAHVPVGRGRHRRGQRPLRVPQPHPRPVERAGRPAQGATVRPDQRPGQPRRGRQGVLVAPRRHSDPLLRPAALPLPAGRLPVCHAARRERPPLPDRARVRARRHRCPRRAALLRRRRHPCQGRARRPLHDGRRDQPRPRPGAAGPAAPADVPQHLALGRRRPHPEPAAGHPARGGDARGRRGRGDPRPPRPLPPVCRGRTAAPVLRQRDRRRRPVGGRRQRHGVPEGRGGPRGRAR